MKKEKSPQIEYLKKEIIKTFIGSDSADGFTNFAALSSDIYIKINERISESTMKRIWGYVSLNPKPRLSTLDILARYVGRHDFKELSEELKDSSDFFTSRKITYRDLEDGCVLNVGWHPERRVRILHLSGTEFKVLDGGSSKLETDDLLSIQEFIIGQPLYVSNIRRGDKVMECYVAGKRMGISYVEED